MRLLETKGTWMECLQSQQLASTGQTRHKHRMARTDLLFLILFTSRILFQLGDLGSEQFGGLIRISHFLPLVLLRHGG